MTITRSDGTINLNSHSIKGTLYLQGTDRSKTLTINNGTITGSIDGKDGFNTTFTYWSNIVLNDITVNGQVYSECHDITINGGTYKGTVGVYTYQNAEYTSTLTVNEGCFYKIFELNQGSITGGNAVGGNVVLYGGSFVEKPTRYTYYNAPSGLENDSFIASGKTVVSCNDTVSGATFNYKVVPAYTLTFNANNGNLPSGASSTQKVGYTGKYGEFGNLPTPTRNGYTFAGWYTSASGGTQVTDTTQYNTNGNSTIYAHWTAIVASVTAGGTTTSYTSLSDALSAWTDDSTLTLLNNVETSSTINISGTKKLDLNGHKMTTHNHFYIFSGSTLELYDNEGGGLIDAQYRVGSAFWINGGKLILNGGTVNANVSTAGIVDIAANAEFTMNGGKITGTSTGRYDASVIRFTGSNGTFTMTGGEISDTTTVGGVTYFEKTDVNINIFGNAKISDNKLQSYKEQNLYLANGVKINVADSMSDDASIGVTMMQTPGVFTNSTNTDYNDKSKFFSDDDNYIVGKNADNQLLIGVPCTVTYQANGHGTAPTAIKVASGSTITEPTELTASGWTFGGWYNGDTKFDFNTPITEDMTLTAKWVKKPTYTVTIPADVNCSDHNSASAVVSAEYDVGELYTLSVTVASENNFRLKADYDDSVLIPYTIMCDDTRLSTGQTEILSVSGSGEQNKTLNFFVDPNQMYAGAYNDNLTFHISLN